MKLGTKYKDKSGRVFEYLGVVSSLEYAYRYFSLNGLPMVVIYTIKELADFLEREEWVEYHGK